MKWSNAYRKRLVLIGVVTVVILSVVNARGAGFADDFDRPDGEVGNGWEIWKAGNLDIKIVDNEVLISGQQRGDWNRSGIYRTVDGETRFSFDFKADDNLAVHIELFDYKINRGVDFYAWPGGSFSFRYDSNRIAIGPAITGQYHNLVVEQEGVDFTLTLDGQVIGTFTSNNTINIEEVFLGADAANGTVGSLHIDNVEIGTSDEAGQANSEDGAAQEDTWTPLFTFGEPINLGPTVNTEAHECFSTISSDGLELYFFDLYFVRPGGLAGS